MKKAISNSEELNNYYKMINTKLKKYSDMNISHDKIAKYLMPGTQNFSNFISEDDDLKDVDGIEVVLKDIIHDIYGAFKDGLFKKIQNGSIKKFENYMVNESIFNFQTTEEDIHKHERALADIYKVSISYIECIKEDIHLYSVNDDGVMRKVMVFTTEEIEKVKTNILEKLIDSTKNKFYSFKNISDLELGMDKKLQMKDVLDYDKVKALLDKEITEDDIVETIASNVDLNIEVKFQKKTNLNSVDYYLFEIVSGHN